MKLRKIAALFTTALMALGFAACGDGVEPETAVTAETDGVEADSTETEEKTGETFKLGVFLQLTGSNSIGGTEANNTLDIMVDYINENGGFNGAQIEKIVYDSQGSPEEAVKIASKLINEDKVDAVVGSVNSGEILAAGQSINDAGLFMMGLGTANTWIAEDWPYVFRATVNNANLSVNVVDMINEIGYTNIAVVNGQDDASLSTADAFIEYAEEAGIEILTRETYAQSDSDFSAQVARIVAVDPECVYMTCSGEHIGPFIKQLRQGGYNGILYSKEILPLKDAAIAGEENSKYLAASYPYVVYEDIADCENEIITGILQKYIERYGEMPVSDSVYRAYDTMMVMWEASKIAGSNDSDALKDAMPEVKVEGCGGTLFYDDGTREGYHTSNNWIYIGEGVNKDYSTWLSEDYEAFKTETGREK